MQELISIGDLSRLTSLSQKALRLYDARGLLRPAHTDPRTGFRYYGHDEVDRSRRIAMLRAVGMPLDDIAEVLDAPDGPHAAEVVGRYWRGCRDLHQARASLVAHIQEQLRTGAPACLPAHRRVAEQKVVSIRGHADAGSLPSFLPQACEELFALLRAEELPLSGPVFTVFHGLVSEDAEGAVEVCAPTEGRVEPRGRIGVRLEPAHAQVFVSVAPPDAAYPKVLAAHDAASGWLGRNELPPAGPAREISYPGGLATDVAYPHTCGSACAALTGSDWPDDRWTRR